MQTQKPENILVLGAGNFGTCLAAHLSRLGHNVTLWAREKEIVDSINQNHRNSKYLKDVLLPPRLKCTDQFQAKQQHKYQVLLLAIPTQFMRSVLEQFGNIEPSTLVVCAAKGIEVGTEKLPLEIISDTLGGDVAKNSVALSGPSFAIEVAQEQPTGVSIGSHSEERVLWAQNTFHSPRFRAYTSDDPVGLEIAGALKNVIAIASGACAGLGFLNNSRATLITRGLAEITRMGVAMGANPLTFKGLGGVGDLFLTCTSEKSRNFTVGYRLGQGERLEDILDTVGSVAEGVATTKSAKILGERLGVSHPIISAVHKVLYEDTPIAQAVKELMTRDAKPELG